jgi:hypothetical protein
MRVQVESYADVLVFFDLEAETLLTLWWCANARTSRITKPADASQSVLTHHVRVLTHHEAC